MRALQQALEAVLADLGIRWGRQVCQLPDLRIGSRPRTGPLQAEVVRAFAVSAAMGEAWPPVIVHAETCSILDGAARAQAAWERGAPRIAALVIDDSEATAFLAATCGNVIIGRPLTVRDRQVAVKRIVASHSHLNTRTVCRVTGASPGVVRRARAAHRPLEVSPAEAMVTDPRTDARELLRRVALDPAVRHTEVLRDLVRGIDRTMSAIERLEQHTAEVPSHQQAAIASVLADCARRVHHQPGPRRRHHPSEPSG